MSQDIQVLIIGQSNTKLMHTDVCSFHYITSIDIDDLG